MLSQSPKILKSIMLAFDPCKDLYNLDSVRGTCKFRSWLRNRYMFSRFQAHHRLQRLALF